MRSCSGISSRGEGEGLQAAAKPFCIVVGRVLAFDEVPVQRANRLHRPKLEPTMPKILAALIALGLLAGCQSQSEQEDRPIIKMEDCKPRDLESGACVPE
jgi:hypothetical protein